MKSIIVLFFSGLLQTVAGGQLNQAFITNLSSRSKKPSLMMTPDPTPEASCDGRIHPSLLAGDPSLNLVTNVDLGEKKLQVMMACSDAIEQYTGKPKKFIAVTIQDKADILFGGSGAPCALACMYSIGAIGQNTNGAITRKITDALEPFGVDEERIYINFFDMERANVGWRRQTFAG